MFLEKLQERLNQHAADHLYRERLVLNSPQQVNITVNGTDMLSFCSNDYLGLANHPEIINAYKTGVDLYGHGSGASHLISGHNEAHRQLEEQFAEFLGRERALLFNNGYLANLGVLQALATDGDIIYQDKLNHASLIDAGLLSRAKMLRYAHNNLEHLETLLAQQQSGQKFIVTDGVFSMGGDIAPLPELVALAKKYDACLIVDDAHSIGILGEGRGTLAHFNLTQDDIPVLIAPLGKAFGSFGAIVAGNKILIEALIQFARTYIYTTAMPAALAYASQKSLSLVMRANEHRDHLQSLINYFKIRAKEKGLNFLDSDTPIQSFIIGDAKATDSVQKNLIAQGFLVGGIRPPTVPKNTGRLRITLSALHQTEHIDQLLDALTNFSSPLAGEGVAKATDEGDK